MVARQDDAKDARGASPECRRKEALEEKERFAMSAARLAGVGALLGSALTAVAPAQVIYEQWPHVDAGVKSAGAPGQFPETRFGDNVLLGMEPVAGLRWVGHALDPGQIAGFLVELRRNDAEGAVAGEVVYGAVIPYDATRPTPLDPNEDDGGTNVQHTVFLAPVTVGSGAHYVTIGAITSKPFTEEWYWNRTAAPVDFISCVETTIFTGFICINPGDLALQVLGVATADGCVDATPIFEGVTAFDTTGAATDGPAHDPGVCSPDGQVHADLWFRYTATCTGLLGLSTCGEATFDTAIAVYADGACPPDAASLLACNDDGPTCPGGTSSLAVPVSEGESYLVRVGGAAEGEDGTGGLELELLAAGGGVLRLDLPAPITGFDADDEVTVTLVMSGLCGTATGYRASLIFDPDALVFEDATYADEPFGLQVPVESRVTGRIDLAAYAQPALGQGGSSADATLAELRFTTLRPLCVPPVAFAPSGQASLLLDAGGNPLPGHELEVAPPSSGILADVDGNGTVDVDDLLQIILQWGPCPFPGAECSADLDCSGSVNVDDLVTVILGWS